MLLQLLLHVIFIYSTFCQEVTNSTSLPPENNKNVTELPINTTTIDVTTTPLPEDNYQYIVKLEYHFIEDKIPEFICGIVADGIEDTKITILDLITLSGIQYYTLNDVLTFLDMIGIPAAEVFTVDILESILNNLQTPFANFYVALNQTLRLPPAAISQIIKDLQIDSGKFTLAMVLGEYNIYDVLRNGSFTNATVQQAAQTAGIPLADVFNAVKNVLLENLRKLDRKDFDNLLRENGVDQMILLRFWKMLGITTEEVYQVDSLRNLLGEIIINLNSKTSIGVITSRNTLLLHTRDYETCQRIRYNIDISVRSFLNDNITIGLGQMITKTTRNIVEVNLRNRSNEVIDVGVNYTSFTFPNCTYVTYVNNILIFQKVAVVRNNGDYLDFDKNNQTFFTLGSPLICYGRLYGMATEDYYSTINFDSFYNYNSETRTTVLPTTDRQKHNGCASDLRVDILLLAISGLYILCLRVN